jgi:hypothetical protein
MQIVPAMIGSLTRFGQPGTEVAPIDLDTEIERWEERANWLLPSASWSELLRPDRAAHLAAAANFRVMMVLSLRLAIHIFHGTGSAWPKWSARGFSVEQPMG